MVNMELIKHIYVPDKNITARRTSKLDAFLRRFLDIFASFWGLFFLAPIFLILAGILKRDSTGPVFYRGPRVGKNGREFGILKFRTMYERPETYAGARVTAAFDDRITPFGHWLRDTKVNELPQLWNVLVGDMSLVGPRPEDPKIAADWPAEARQEILSVRPGITSPASIMFRDEEKLLTSSDPMDDYLRDLLPSKLRMDMLYIRRRNLLNDLDIIFMTLVTLLPLLRKMPVPERALYNGPVFQFVKKFLNWFFIDWVISTIGVVITGVIWRLSGPIDLGFGPAIIVAFVVALAFSLINALLRLNRVVWQKAPAGAVLDLAISAGITTGMMLAINQIKWLQPTLPPSMLVLMGVLSFTGFVATRYRERVITGLATRWLALRRQPLSFGERTVIIGAGEMGSLASWLMKRQEFSRAFSVVGYIDDDPQKSGSLVDGSPVLGSTSDLPAIIQKHDISLLLFAISNLEDEERHRILEICQRAGVRVVIFPNILDDVRSSLLSRKNSETIAWIEPRAIENLLDEVQQSLDEGNIDSARTCMAEFKKQHRLTRGAIQENV